MDELKERRLNAQVPPELYEAAKVKAAAEDLSLSQVVRRLLREYTEDGEMTA